MGIVYCEGPFIHLYFLLRFLVRFLRMHMNEYMSYECSEYMELQV
jgi:hypothetical protein